MMPKLTESSTETSVVANQTTSAAKAYLAGTFDIVARKGAHPTRDKQKYPADAGAPEVLKDSLGKPGHIPVVQVGKIVASVKTCH